MNNKYIAIGLIVLFAVASRLVPHPYNFSPFAAIALLGGLYLDSKVLRYAVPLLAAWISGVILNNTIYASLHPNFVWFDSNILWQGIAYVGIAFIGEKFVNKDSKYGSVAVLGLIASVVFFILTNFGYWASGIFYSQTGAGLAACYAAGLPFLTNALIGDVVYALAFFAIYQYVRSYQKQLTTA